MVSRLGSVQLPSRTSRDPLEARLQKRLQRYGWDKAAPHYERGWRAQLEPAQTASLEMLGPTPGERILDVACGTGLVSLRAARRVMPDGIVVGTDLSEKMVDQARAWPDAKLLTNVYFARMDAENLDFAAGSFDAAICALGLMYVPEPDKALAEMHRVVRRGGRVACAVWGRRSKCGWAQIFPIVDARVQSEVCPLFFRLGAIDVLETAFRDAGFTDIKSTRIATMLDYANADEACGAAFVGGPVALAYERFSEATKGEARSAYLESLASYRQGDAYAIPGEFVVVCGTR